MLISGRRTFVGVIAVLTLAAATGTARVPIGPNYLVADVKIDSEWSTCVELTEDIAGVSQEPAAVVQFDMNFRDPNPFEAQRQAVQPGRTVWAGCPPMNVRYYSDPETDEPHIYNHDVDEPEVEDALVAPG